MTQVARERTFEPENEAQRRALAFLQLETNSSGSAPYVEKNTSSTSPTTATSSDGFASATMPAGAWSRRK